MLFGDILASFVFFRAWVRLVGGMDMERNIFRSHLVLGFLVAVIPNTNLFLSLSLSAQLYAALTTRLVSFNAAVMRILPSFCQIWSYLISPCLLRSTVSETTYFLSSLAPLVTFSTPRPSQLLYLLHSISCYRGIWSIGRARLHLTDELLRGIFWLGWEYSALAQILHSVNSVHGYWLIFNTSGGYSPSTQPFPGRSTRTRLFLSQSRHLVCNSGFSAEHSIHQW